MKMAVCGGGPTALEAAWYFHQLGADVTVFASGELGGMARRMARKHPHMPGSRGTLAQEWEEHLLPLIQKVQSEVRIRPARALRAHKRFLSHAETIPGRTRLLDMFRVVFVTDASESIREQMQENPEAFKETLEKYGPEFLQSLKSPIESFEDFDLVLDCRGPFQKATPMGPAGTWALNEASLFQDAEVRKRVVYGLRELLDWEAPEDAHHVMILGDDPTAAVALVKLWAWAQERPERHLTVASTLSSLPQGPGLEQVLKEENEVWALRVADFEKKIAQWKELEPHVQAKIPRPAEPVRKLDFLPGHNATALDRLIDRPGLFVTLERPDFRGEAALVTLGPDAIVVATGHRPEKDFSQGVREVEPGYYTLSSAGDIPAVEKDILSYFSRA